MSQQHIQRMERAENGQRLNTDHLPRLAAALGVNAFELFEDFVPGPRHMVRVPVLSAVQAGAFAEASPAVSLTDLNDIDNWVYIDHPSETLLALRVEGTSMDKVAAAGSIVIVDYAIKNVGHNQLGVFAHEGAATFKRLRADDRGSWLEPDSTDPRHLPIFPPPGEVIEIVGPVVDIKLVMT